MDARQTPISKRVVIVACGGDKAISEGELPAGELYTGSYHWACRKAAEALGGHVLILSALHGLVELTDVIETYDLKMGEPGSIDAGAVRDQAAWQGILDADVTVLGGEKYVSVVKEVWPNATAPLKGGIGEQRQQLAIIYGGEKPRVGPDGLICKYTELQAAISSSVFVYGGKDRTGPSQARKVRTRGTDEGQALLDLETNELIDVMSSETLIWWTPMPAEHYEQFKPKGRSKPQPKKPKAHYRGRFGNVPTALPSRHRPQGQGTFWFGGKAGRKNPEPGEWRLAYVIYTGEGAYEVIDKETDETLLTCRLTTQVYYAYSEHSTLARPDPEEDKIPKNIRYMMENAATEAARASWARVAAKLYGNA